MSICPHCATDFPPRRSDQVYCTPKCRIDHYHATKGDGALRGAITAVLERWNYRDAGGCDRAGAARRGPWRGRERADRAVAGVSRPRASPDLFFVLEDRPMLRLDHVLSRGPGRQRDGAQASTGGRLRDVDRDFNDFRGRRYRLAGAG